MNQVLLSQIYALNAAGTSDVANVSARDFQNIAVWLVGRNDDSDQPAVFSVRVKGSLQELPPDFTTPSDIGNQWSYIQLKDDVADGYLNGDEGVVFDQNDTVSVELNTSVLTWVALEVFNYTSGNLRAQFVFKNNQ